MGKWLCFVLCFQLLHSALLAQEQPHSLTFSLADVKPAENLLPEIEAEKIIEANVPYLESHSARDRKFVADDEVTHPVISALYLSFGQHRPIVISPDIIWLLICQGFAKHVELYSEELRDKIVNHKGKVTLSVQRDDFVKGKFDNPWQEVFPEFCKQIQEHTKDDIYNWIVPKFSTTDSIETASFQVTLMEVTESYFYNDFVTICGIPSVTLEGTTEDWENIRQRIDKLEGYGLKWWADELKPVIEKIVETSKGNIDKDFWNSIFCDGSRSGEPSYIDGWITRFFPYAPRMEKNFHSGILIHKFPSGLANVDFDWFCFDKKIKMKFVAGFVGVSQNQKSLALTPEIGWAVSEAKYSPFYQNYIIWKIVAIASIAIGFIFLVFVYIWLSKKFSKNSGKWKPDILSLVFCIMVVMILAYIYTIGMYMMFQYAKERNPLFVDSAWFLWSSFPTIACSLLALNLIGFILASIACFQKRKNSTIAIVGLTANFICGFLWACIFIR